MERRLFALVGVVFATAALGEALPLPNTTFLIEEAWRSDAAIMQHAVWFTEEDRTYVWTLELATPERPHRFSMSLPVTIRDPALLSVSEISLDYAWQFMGQSGDRMALSPRVSLIVPIDGHTLRSDALGIDVAVPLTVLHRPSLATHWNVRAGWSPRAGGRIETALGFGAVRAVGERLIAVLETELGTYSEGGDRIEELIVSPALRWRLEPLASRGIFPGFAVPITHSSGDFTVGVVFQMMFEHELSRSSE